MGELGATAEFHICAASCPPRLQKLEDENEEKLRKMGENNRLMKIAHPRFGNVPGKASAVIYLLYNLLTFSDIFFITVTPMEGYRYLNRFAHIPGHRDFII